MSELIERQALKESLTIDYASVIYAIDNAPTIDPVIHGEWTGTYGATCNICGNIDAKAYIGRTVNFCSNCGAKMDGKRKRGNPMIDRKWKDFLKNTAPPCNDCPDRDDSKCKFYNVTLDMIDGFGYVPCLKCEEDCETTEETK